MIYLHEGSLVVPRLAAFMTPAALLLYLYLQKIALIIDDTKITLVWPMQGRKSLSWDEIVQVRRSDAPPGKFFFIDLIASPDRCIQFNPFFFNKPGDIIHELNKHLRFELLGDPANEKSLAWELAADAETHHVPLSKNQKNLIAALLVILAAVALYIYLHG